MAAWYALGNLIGGVMLVTGLRLVQLGKARIDEERAAPRTRPAAKSDPPDDGITPDGRQT